MNSSERKDNKSGYRGVSWSKTDKKWRARASLDGKVIFLGNFDTKEAARMVYEKFTDKHYGEFKYRGPRRAASERIKGKV